MSAGACRPGCCGPTLNWEPSARSDADPVTSRGGMADMLTTRCTNLSEQYNSSGGQADGSRRAFRQEAGESMSAPPATWSAVERSSRSATAPVRLFLASSSGELADHTSSQWPSGRCGRPEVGGGVIEQRLSGIWRPDMPAMTSRPQCTRAASGKATAVWTAAGPMAVAARHTGRPSAHDAHPAALPARSPLKLSGAWASTVSFFSKAARSTATPPCRPRPRRTGRDCRGQLGGDGTGA